MRHSELILSTQVVYFKTVLTKCIYFLECFTLKEPDCIRLIK